MEQQQSSQISIINKESFSLEKTKELEKFFKVNDSIEFIQKVIDDKIKFDMDSLIYMMETNTKRRDFEDPIVKKVSDINATGKYQNMLCLCEDDKELFVAGDIHADLVSLTQILKKTGFYDDYRGINLLFLGDYVDRGKNRLNVINLLITLEFLLSKNIYLLKGNHELFIKDENGVVKSPMMGSENISYFFTFVNMLANHPEYQKSFPKVFIESYAEYFDNLPVIGLLNFEDIKIMAVHGGLPRASMQIDNYYKDDSLNYYLDKATKDFVGMTLPNGFLWSDPYDKAPQGFRNKSNSRYQFNKDQFISFSKIHGIDIMLRAHEALDDGYQSYFDNRLISVFSTGGKDIKGNINENSHYKDVAPNILYIDTKTKEVKSLELFFDNSDMYCEKRITFANIQTSKKNQEFEYVDFISDTTTLNKIPKEQKEVKVLTISDKFNPNLRKTVTLKDKTSFSFKQISHHSDFYGVHKDMDFIINIDTNTITNNSHIKIHIDRYILKMSDSLPFVEGEYRFESGATLYFSLV